MSSLPRPCAPGDGWSIPGRAASPPSASSSSERSCAPPSRSASSSGWRRPRWVTRLRRTREIGPQARHDLRDALHRQVEASIAKGARCLLGGKIPDGSGAYYPPTVLTDVRKGMPAYDEELFGPVAAIIPVKDEGEAIAAANDSASAWAARSSRATLARGERIAAELIESGCVFVNENVQIRSAAALRRHQGERLRPRALRLRHQGIRQHQDRVRCLKSAGVVPQAPRKRKPRECGVACHAAEGSWKECSHRLSRLSGSRRTHDQAPSNEVPGLRLPASIA